MAKDTQTARDCCRFVLGEQRGEIVECGAAKAIHGDGLGMVGGHTFVPDFCWVQWPTREGDLHRAGDHFCSRTPGHGGRHRCPCEATTTASDGVPTTTPHCAGRLAVAHPRTEMVQHRTGWKCPECDERWDAERYCPCNLHCHTESESPCSFDCYAHHGEVIGGEWPGRRDR